MAEHTDELALALRGRYKVERELGRAVFDPVRNVPVFRDAVERIRQRDEGAYNAVREPASRR